jgi:hypothetical protein
MTKAYAGATSTSTIGSLGPQEFVELGISLNREIQINPRHFDRNISPYRRR